MKHPAKLALLLAIVTTGGAHADSSGDDHHHFPTATPITHLVVIFNENISFDHYFGTYPIAQNNAGETPFFAAANTPRSINTLLTPLDTTNHFAPLKNLDLIHHNPNGPGGSGAAVNGVNAANPFRLAPSQAATVDQGHAPQAEQLAYDNGLLDRFPADTGNAGGSASLPPIPTPTSAAAATKGLVMGYYDGNTVTALWNYAQHFALNDNHYTSQFGPSSPGAIDLISGQSNGFAALQGVVDANGNLLHPSHEAADGAGGYTLVGDADPLGDVCSTAADQVSMAGRNIGDRLNVGGMTWGWFEGGFDLSIVNPNGSTGCARYTTPTVTPFAYFSTDYIPHHQPFQYYPSTRNLTHARPSSVAAIGHSFIPHTTTPEPANHQYDLEDFFAALSAGNLPAVSFLKAAAYQDAHAGNSDPIDEQHFLVRVINALQRSAEWPTTAVIIAYDDSDGWYDHQMPPIVNPSFDPTLDVLNGPGVCDRGFQQGSPTPSTPLNGYAGLPANGRCGYGTRMPLLVISRYAKQNYVDHALTDQSSILRFIEDNWLAGQRIQPGGSFDTIAGRIDNMFDFSDHDRDDGKLWLDPATGAPIDPSVAQTSGPGRP